MAGRIWNWLGANKPIQNQRYHCAYQNMTQRLFEQCDNVGSTKLSLVDLGSYVSKELAETFPAWLFESIDCILAVMDSEKDLCITEVANGLIETLDCFKQFCAMPVAYLMESILALGCGHSTFTFADWTRFTQIWNLTKRR